MNIRASIDLNHTISLLSYEDLQKVREAADAEIDLIQGVVKENRKVFEALDGKTEYDKISDIRAKFGCSLIQSKRIVDCWENIRDKEIAEENFVASLGS